MRFFIIFFLSLITTGSVNAKPIDTAEIFYQKGDYASALKFIQPLADQGDVTAQSLLGDMYLAGNGVSKDSTEAFKWYQKAAQKGDAKAEYNLGKMYEDGLGVSPNTIEAMKWYNAARAQGYSLVKAPIPASINYITVPPGVTATTEKLVWQAFDISPFNIQSLMPKDERSVTIVGPNLSAELSYCEKGPNKLKGITKLLIPTPLQLSEDEKKEMRAQMEIMRELLEKLSKQKIPVVNFDEMPPVTLYSANNENEREALSAVLRKAIQIQSVYRIRPASTNELEQLSIWKGLVDHVEKNKKTTINEPVFVMDDREHKYLFNFYPNGSGLFWIEDVSSVDDFP